MFLSVIVMSQIIIKLLKIYHPLLVSVCQYEYSQLLWIAYIVKTWHCCKTHFKIGLSSVLKSTGWSFFHTIAMIALCRFSYGSNRPTQLAIRVQEFLTGVIHRPFSLLASKLVSLGVANLQITNIAGTPPRDHMQRYTCFPSTCT